MINIWEGDTVSVEEEEREEEGNGVSFIELGCNFVDNGISTEDVVGRGNEVVEAAEGVFDKYCSIRRRIKEAIIGFRMVKISEQI